MPVMQQVVNGKTYAAGSPGAKTALDANTLAQGQQEGRVAGVTSGQADVSKWNTKYPGYATPKPIYAQDIMSQFTGSLNALQGITGQAGAPGSMGEMPTTPGVSPIDMTASNAAAFARAKDQVGQTSQGALAGLRSALGGRGMLGSGSESRGAASVINKGQGQLGEVSREGAIHQAESDADTAHANQTAAITQRGQDLTARAAHDSTAVEQAKVIADTRMRSLQMLLSVLKPPTATEY